jgi:hypothetical protein
MRTVLLRYAALSLAIVSLAGCAEFEARRQQQQMAQAQAVAANEDAQCRSYGAEPGSPAYIQCRMNFDNQRAQMRAALASQLIGRMGPPPPPQTLNVNVCNVPGQVNTCMYPH